ncbi:MAG: IMP dehydrogenase, partial [Caldilineaceae bacterium]|nr:IMP dehydrogenase [Caldilineaceae bacterium]
MNIRAHKGLTFDDVLLVPKRSPIASRRDVDTSAAVTNTIRLATPILSANMDTVTEWEMAVAMARAGGMGVLHRFMSVEQQVRQVNKVKRAQGLMVDNPYTVAENASIAEADRLMEQHDVGGLIVVNGDKKLVGLITRRDILLAPDDVLTVAQAMTRADHIVSVGPSVTSAEARALLYQHRLEKLPVVDRDGKVVGLITSRDVVRVEERSQASVDGKGRLRVAAATGVGKAGIERAEALLDAGADLLVLDIAHGHADHCIDMVKSLRRAFADAQIVAGNVATADGARELAEAGADAIKVGIGPGSICT